MSDELHEVTWDGRTVWVNSGIDGGSLARFSRAGVDVHTSTSEQLLSGRQCLACTHRRGEDMTLAAWAQFKALVRHFYAVTIPDAAMPDYLT
jgi:hypothetical protein